MADVKSFHGFIGMKDITDSLRRLIEGCMSGSGSVHCLPPILLSGNSGYGKSLLATSISRAFSTTMHRILAGKQVTRLSIAETLSRLEEADVVFVDEAHSLGKSSHVQELFYPALDSSVTLRVDVGKTGSVLTNEWIPIKPVTYIFATDRPGELRNALRRRLPLSYSLLGYTEPELREIAAKTASEMGILISTQSTRMLASASKGSPRNIAHLLQKLRLYFPASETQLGNKEIAHMLRGERIDRKMGLGPLDKAYLQTLAVRDKPMSLASVSLSLGYDCDYIAKETEGFLVKQGLVAIEKGGRVVTDIGKEYLSKEKA